MRFYLNDRSEYALPQRAMVCGLILLLESQIFQDILPNQKFQCLNQLDIGIIYLYH